jgi:hypothetical protein
LKTILLAPENCGTSPCIDPIFGPTAAAVYWSATTNATDPSTAWVADFKVGLVGIFSKSISRYVRAVRAGL